MTYKVKPDPKVEDTLKKLAKKDRVRFDQVLKKLKELEKDPAIGKPLRNVLKGKRRLHIGNYVLMYTIDENEKLIRLLDFDHHDNVY